MTLLLPFPVGFCLLIIVLESSNRQKLSLQKNALILNLIAVVSFVFLNRSFKALASFSPTFLTSSWFILLALVLISAFSIFTKPSFYLNHSRRWAILPYGWQGSGTPSSPYVLNFDGVADYISIPHNSALEPTASITVSAWINQTSIVTNGKVVSRPYNKTSWPSPYGSYILTASEGGGGTPSFSIAVSGARTNLISSKAIKAGNWYNLTGIYDGSDLSLFINGSLINTANVSGSIDYTGGAANLDIGQDTEYSNVGEYFNGKMGNVSIYSRNLSASEVKTNFDAMADRFRTTPVGNIVTDGLVLNLDAANAMGTAPYANGCAASDLSWLDLSTSVVTGTLTNFSSCGSSTGWNGDGTTTVSGTAGPYRMTFNGTNNYISIPSTFLGTSVTSDFTVQMWLYPTDLSNYVAVFDSLHRSLSLWIGSGYSSIGGVNVAMASFFTTNAWQNLAMTRSGSAVTYYRNGSAYDYKTNAGTIFSETWEIGGNPSGGGAYFTGSMADILVYSQALSSDAISQNCNALKSRFSGATCN